MQESIKKGEKIFEHENPKWIEQTIKELEEIEDVTGLAGRQMMYEWNRSHNASWWKAIRKRKVGGTVEDIAKDNLYNIETDLAQIMGLAKAQAVRLTAGQKYIDDMLRYAEQKGVVIPESVAKSPKLLYETLVKQFGEKEAKLRLREGFRPITGVKSAKGMWAASSIADEIKETMTTLNNRASLGRVLQELRQSTEFLESLDAFRFPIVPFAQHDL